MKPRYACSGYVEKICAIENMFYWTPIFSNSFFITKKGCERCKLYSSIIKAHPWMSFRDMMREIDYVIILSYHALCPPICLLCSRAVEPSSKFNPRNSEFFPKRCLMFNIVSCIRCSRASSFLSLFY